MNKYAMGFLMLLVLLAAPVVSQSVDLGGLLGAATGQLGVSEEQASGGMGALLGTAKENMGGSKYGELLSMVPGLAGLAGDAGGSAGGLMGAASSALGGGSGLGQAAQLTDTFKGLGLSPDMVGKFAEVALDYL
jgi:hypothetical protein